MKLKDLENIEISSSMRVIIRFNVADEYESKSNQLVFSEIPKYFLERDVVSIKESQEYLLIEVK